jgi:hypothetical protein
MRYYKSCLIVLILEYREKTIISELCFEFQRLRTADV